MAVVSTLGTIQGGTIANESLGLTVWANPTNASGNGGGYATSSLAAGAASDRLLWTDLTSLASFLPDDAIIRGISILRDAKGSASGAIKGASGDAVGLWLAGAVRGTAKEDEAAWALADEMRTFGGQNDLWGTTWTAAQVKDAGFGYWFRARNDDAGAQVASVDFARITIHYADPVAGTFGRLMRRPYLRRGVRLWG